MSYATGYGVLSWTHALRSRHSFTLRRVLITDAARRELTLAGDDPQDLLFRHVTGDPGDRGPRSGPVGV
jgi:hypothetical protein